MNNPNRGFLPSQNAFYKQSNTDNRGFAPITMDDYIVLSTRYNPTYLQKVKNYLVSLGIVEPKSEVELKTKLSELPMNKKLIVHPDYNPLCYYYSEGEKVKGISQQELNYYSNAEGVNTSTATNETFLKISSKTANLILLCVTALIITFILTKSK